MDTCGQQEKLRLDLRYNFEFFSEKQKIILEVCWIKLFLSGLIKFRFYELGQQERGQGFIRNKCDA